VTTVPLYKKGIKQNQDPEAMPHFQGGPFGALMPDVTEVLNIFKSATKSTFDQMAWGPNSLLASLMPLKHEVRMNI